MIPDHHPTAAGSRGGAQHQTATKRTQVRSARVPGAVR